MAQTQPRLTPAKTEKRLRGFESRSASGMNSTPTCSTRVGASVVVVVVVVVMGLLDASGRALLISVGDSDNKLLAANSTSCWLACQQLVGGMSNRLLA